MKDYLSMTIYKNKNDGLLLYAPFSIDDDNIEAMEALGNPEVILIPNENEYSFSDVMLFKNRYPNSKVVCPEAIKENIMKHVDVDLSVEQWLSSENIDYMTIINPPLKSLFENVYELNLNRDQKAIFWGEILWNLESKTGIFWKTIAIMGAAGDGKQPQVSLVHRSLGFENKNIMKTFFFDIYNRIQSKRVNRDPSLSMANLPDLENIQRIIESSDEMYPIMIYQHGEPTILRSDKKLKKIIDLL